MAESIKVQLSPDHVRQLGGTDAMIAQAEKEWAAKQEQEQAAEPEKTAEQEQVEAKADPKTPEAPAPVKPAEVPADPQPKAQAPEAPKVEPKDAYAKEMELINDSLKDITDEKLKSLVDAELAKVIDEKFDTYKDKPQEERVELLTGIAEKRARKLYNEELAKVNKDAELKKQHEEATKTIKEVSSFVKSAPATTTADTLKKLEKRAESGDEDAISELLTLQRSWSIPTQ